MKKEYIYAFFFTLLIFILNYFLRTMLQFTPAEWQQVYSLHLSDIPFKFRPLTNGAIYFLVNYFSLSIATSFVLHQYVLLFVFFISFAYYLRALQYSQTERIVGLFITALSYPILCVHFIPNYTWDNLWLYIGLIWFGYFLAKRQFYLASLFLLFSTISHESALFVTIAFYFFRDKSKSQLHWLIPASIPAFSYLVFRLFFYPHVMTGRFTHVIGNFENVAATRQTFYSIFVSFGWMWVVLIWGYIYRKKLQKQFKLFEPFLYSSLFTAIITICTVIFVGKTRETRLFYTPFLFIIPFVLSVSSDFFSSFVRMYTQKSKLINYIVIMCVLSLTVFVSVYIFPTFSFLPMIDFHRVYFAINLSVVCIALLTSKFYKSNI